MTKFINIAVYKFVELEDLAKRKSELLPYCRSLDLKGTILLSNEGINMFLAGTRQSIDLFLAHLRSQPEFADLKVKESESDHQPFSRMLVRLKKEIISMGMDEIKPICKTSPKISASELKRWLDEGRELTLLDVRNDYEVEMGTFENAVPIGIDHFRKFPAATDELPADIRSKPVVMFCTGGIRCEKAGPLMEEKGFEEVFQLDGGILKYFEECGGEHYEGDCFVFDKRVAVDPDLNETDAEQCYACQTILTADDQASDRYDPPHSCPHCFQTKEQKMAAVLKEREARLQELTTPLPGSIAYDNVRPMNVPQRFDRQPLIDFLAGMHAKLDREFWREECGAGRVTYKDQLLAADTEARAGWRIHHHVSQTTEPDVSRNVGFLFEDADLIAIDKPAPLPMHPCGRFNRNTLQHFLDIVYSGEQVRILHRLDADTKGVVLLARKKSAASFVQQQFKKCEVRKTYLARVIGQPKEHQFDCDSPISANPATGGVRQIEADGLSALTQFEVVERFNDGTSLIKCFPKTGRTNQIRLHLHSLGTPIVGDKDYRVDGLTNPAGLADMGLCLQAIELAFIHPTSKELTVVKSKARCDFAG